MSGDVVYLAAEVDSVPYRAVACLAGLAPTLPDFALIGGLAVIARLGQAHRATNDVDTVSDDQPGLLDALRAGGLDRRGDSVVLDGDLKLDVIDVGEGDPDYLPCATHRLAFDARTPVELVVRPRQAGPSVAVTVDVARASALVAIKLCISQGVGRQRDPRKVGSDAFDVARHHLVEQVDRTVAAIVRSSVQGVEPIGADQLELLGRAFSRRLSLR